MNEAHLREMTFLREESNCPRTPPVSATTWASLFGLAGPLSQLASRNTLGAAGGEGMTRMGTGWSYLQPSKFRQTHLRSVSDSTKQGCSGLSG